MDKKILFVDDDPNIQKMIEIFLRKYNFNVTFVKSGRSALHKLQEDNYSLVISDIQMPEMDGLTLIEKIKIKYPEIPVVIISAYGQEQMTEKAMAKGASKILNKPFDSKILISTIQEFLEL